MELNKDIKSEKLKKMFEFLNSISDRISIERYCVEKIPDEEFKKVQQEYREYILKADIERREEYYNNKNNIRSVLEMHLGISNDKKAKRYFDELLRQDLEVLKSVKNNGEKRFVNTIEEDVIEKRYTRITSTTQGPLFQQYYIKVGKLLKRIEENMESIFSYPYIINNEEYENLTFYKGKKAILSICSHENYAMLDDEQETEFKKIGIELE